MIHALAQELNTVLDGTSLGCLLSDLGRRIYFPKGIIAQSAEAKASAYKANGTIGMACVKGKAVTLPSVQKHLPFLTADEAVAYAPTAGIRNCANCGSKNHRKTRRLKEKLFRCRSSCRALQRAFRICAIFYIGKRCGIGRRPFVGQLRPYYKGAAQWTIFAVSDVFRQRL